MILKKAHHNGWDIISIPHDGTRKGPFPHPGTGEFGSCTINFYGLKNDVNIPTLPWDQIEPGQKLEVDLRTLTTKQP